MIKHFVIFRLSILSLLSPLLYPRFNEVDRVYTGFTSSICPSVHPSVCPSVDRIVSTLDLQQFLLNPFHIYTSYRATSICVSHVQLISKLKSLKFWQILSICNFVFVSFWLGIQYESIVWVIKRQRGYPQNVGGLVVLIIFGNHNRLP